MANSDEAKPNEGTPAEPSLPMVASPKLDGSDDTGEADAQPNESFAADDAAPAPTSRSIRFVALAASLAVAAALGGLAGGLTASAFVGRGRTAVVAASSGYSESGTLAALKAQLAELSALKASLESATRNASGQFAKISDRLDRVERAEIEPAVKLAHIADAVDRLEKKSVVAAVPAAPETTGSIASALPPAAAAEPRLLPEKVLQDWIVQDVHSGRALVASRYGGVFEVGTGSILPGLGRVETIKRQDGQWVVVTGRGIITDR